MFCSIFLKVLAIELYFFYSFNFLLLVSHKKIKMLKDYLYRQD